MNNLYKKQSIWFFIAVFWLFLTPSVYAVTVTWDGSADTSWNNLNNWSTNSVPTSTDDVVIASGTFSPVLDINTTIASLSITGDTLDIGGFTLTVTGTATTSSNGNLTMDGTTDVLDVGGNFSVSREFPP